MSTSATDKAIVRMMHVFQIFIAFFVMWLIAMLVIQGTRLAETESALKRHGCAEAPP